MRLNKLAEYVSIALGQYGWLPVLTILLTIKSGLSNTQVIRLLPILLFLQVVVPIGYIEIGRLLGKISSWDITKREERPVVLLVTFISYLISILLVYLWGNQLLFHLTLTTICLILIFTIISSKWKISLHTGLNTFGPIVINFLFGWQVPILFLLVPVVFWARLRLIKHTIPQLMAGIGVSVTITIAAFKFFGYI